MAECTECGANISTEGRNYDLGEILSCPECGVELEVRKNDPVELAAAPQEQEDWGE